MREVLLELLNQKETSKSKVGRQCFLLPVEFFKTDKTQYIFDADHVVFLDVNEIVYKIVSILNKTPKNIDQLLELLPEYPAADVRQALQEITEIQKQDYLKQHGFQRANPHTVQIIEEYLTHKLKGFYLNITSQCNLSCDYCIFGGAYANQAHLQNQQMTWEIAQKAIDFFLSRASEDETLRIDFFGGEPLIAFPLMKRIVGTLKERLKPRQQEMKIYISSNGTLMNEAIADFLIENQINLQISIDGEKETHDSKRKFKTTREGSFDTILNNMKYIFDRDAEYFKTKVKLKAVITYETLDADGTEFFQNPLIEILNNNKHFTMLDKTPHYDIAKDQDFFAKIHNIGEHLLKKQDASSIEELLDGLSYKKKHLFYATFYEFLPLQVVCRLYYNIGDPVPFTKDCLIGYEGCVNVDGSISICYKANSFIIGNVVENVWYFDQIEAFHQKRYSESNNCQYCFVKRFCKLCYEKISGKEGEFETSIQKYCQFSRYYYHLIFEYMLKVMENNPKLWDVLPEMLEKESAHLKKVHQNKAQAKEFTPPAS